MNTVSKEHETQRNILKHCSETVPGPQIYKLKKYRAIQTGLHGSDHNKDIAAFTAFCYHANRCSHAHLKPPTFTFPNRRHNCSTLNLPQHTTTWATTLTLTSSWHMTLSSFCPLICDSLQERFYVSHTAVCRSGSSDGKNWEHRISSHYEPSQPQRVTSRLETNGNPFSSCSALKTWNCKILQNPQI